MIAIRGVVQASLIAACAAVSFVSIQVFMSAKAETVPHAATVSKADPIALNLTEDRDLGAMRPMSPIYATIKYTNAQLAVPSVKKPIKAKRAARSVNNMPMQIAYVPDIPVAAGRIR